jgi:hypothetical protein
MNPAAAVITLTGYAPTIIAPLYPSTGSVEVTGVAPTLTAGTDRFFYPATAGVTVTGRAPTALQYNEAVINFTRVTVRPALEGRVRINRG